MLSARSASGSLSLCTVRFRVEGVTKAIPKEVERKQGQGEKNGGEYEKPRVGDHFLSAVVDQRTPGAVGWLDAQAEEAEG